MNETLDFLVRHGPVVLFVVVFIEQVGAPIPAAPWVLAAGALAAAGKMNWFLALGAAAFGSVLADLIWFYLGRHYGSRVLRLLCRISLEPDSCARRTQDLYTRYGLRGIVAAKFVPGLSTLAPPLAGNSGLSVVKFIGVDAVAALLHDGFLLSVGVIFSRQLEQIISALANLGGKALIVLAGLVAAYVGYKYFQRRRLLRELRMAKITVDELYQLQEAGGQPIILDLRSLPEFDQDPSVIRGAHYAAVDELERRYQEIPRDRDIILYCSCPNEVSSARMALRLRRKGITRVRPLLGGIDAWREHKYPMDLRMVGAASFPEMKPGEPPI